MSKGKPPRPPRPPQRPSRTGGGPSIDALFAQAVEHHLAGRVAEAAAQYQAIVARRPGHAEAHNNLGNLLSQAGQSAEAMAHFRQALAANPESPSAHTNLGAELYKSGETSDLEQALTHLRRALAIDPGFIRAYNNLGSVYTALGRQAEAIDCLQRALALSPHYAQAHSNLGNSLQELGRLTEALVHLQRAVELQPTLPEAHYNLARALIDAGQVAQAITSYGQALTLRPDFPAARSNLLMALHYDPAQPPEQIAAAHRLFGQLYTRPIVLTPPIAARDPERRLRIGYVSQDLRNHSVAYFIEPILTSHDRSRFEVIAYADVGRGDAITARLRGLVDGWQDIHGLPDAEVAALIRRDRIDILVDLAGHTGGSRLMVFTHRPAPVQVTYLGYPDTTGLPAMDYRLTDAWADPPGWTEHLHTERLVRLPQGFLCYRPPDEAPPVSALPAAATGQITFGSFNNLQKLNARVIATWAAILHAVPGSRLLIKARLLGMDAARQATADLLARQGIDGARVSLLPAAASVAEHLACYSQVDVALDTFPYHGTTTTCEALWMGVPVVTLAGKTHETRVGVSLLTGVGLPDLIAQTPEAYVAIAAQLAEDVPRLEALRTTLRQRVQESGLLASVPFTRSLEARYREMWRAWCAQAPA